MDVERFIKRNIFSELIKQGYDRMVSERAVIEAMKSYSKTSAPKGKMYQVMCNKAGAIAQRMTGKKYSNVK